MGRHPNLDDRGHRQCGAEIKVQTWPPFLPSRDQAKVFCCFLISYSVCTLGGFHPWFLCTTVCSQFFSPGAPSLQGCTKLRSISWRWLSLNSFPHHHWNQDASSKLQLNQNGPDLHVPHTILKGVQGRFWTENGSISFNSAVSIKGRSEWARVVKMCFRSWRQAVGEESSLKREDKTASGKI